MPVRLRDRATRAARRKSVLGAAASVPLAVGALQEAMGKVKTAEAALRRLLVQPPGQAGPHWPRRGGRASVPLVTET